MILVYDIEGHGGLVGCFTQDQGVAGSRLSGVTAFCPLTRHINLVLENEYLLAHNILTACCQHKYDVLTSI